MENLDPFIPPLPTKKGGWSDDVVQAHNELSKWYTHGLKVLSAEDSNSTRLNTLANELEKRCCPLCLGLEISGLPVLWVNDCKDSIIQMILQLTRVARSLTKQ